MSQIGPNYFGGYVVGSGMGLGYGAPALAIIDAYGEPVADTKPAKAIDPVDRSWWNGGLAAQGGYPGFSKAPPLTIPILWQMSLYSIINFAYSLVTRPILSGKQFLEIADNRGDESDESEAKKMLDLANKQVLPFIESVMAQQLQCLNFGWWLSEVVWDRTSDGYTYPCEANPVLPGEATIYRDKYRKFAGFQIANEFRDLRYALLTTNNPWIDPIFGQSRNAYCVEEWWRVRQSQLNADSIEKKASGIQMGLGVAMGQSFTDENGNPIVSKEMAQTLVNTAAQGGCFVYPLTPFPLKNCMQNPALMDIPSVKVTQYDWGNNGPMMDAQQKRVDALNMQIMQAWCRPTREAMEGSSGTKAEAGVHGQIGITDSEWVAELILGQIAKQILDRWAVTNFGKDAAGILVCKQAQLSDPQQQFYQAIYTALATGATPDPELVAQINSRKLGEKVEMPLRTQEETDKKIQDAEAKKQVADEQQQQMAMLSAKTQPAANGKPTKNGNGAAHDAVQSAKPGGRMPLSADELDGLLEFVMAPSAIALEAGTQELTGGNWATIEGSHVYIKEGKIVAGAAHLVGHKVGYVGTPSKDFRTGKSFVTPDKKYAENFGGNIHRVAIRSGKSLDLTKYSHDEDVEPKELASHLAKQGISVDPGGMGRGELHQVINPVRQEIADKAASAGFSHWTQNEHFDGMPTQSEYHFNLQPSSVETWAKHSIPIKWSDGSEDKIESHGWNPHDAFERAKDEYGDGMEMIHGKK